MLERRALAGVELRVAGGARPRLVGYAAVFDRQSVPLPPGFIEIIRPGAFTQTLEAGKDIRALVEHAPASIIGRRSVGNLRIEADSRGLHVDITPPETQAGRDVLENVRIGNLDSMSFAFRVRGEGGERWSFQTPMATRELLDLDVEEVSVVAFPAYPDTEVAVRSLRAVRPQITALRAQMAARAAAWGA